MTLLGSAEPLRWEQLDDALTIALPASVPSKMASSFRISFQAYKANDPAGPRKYKEMVRQRRQSLRIGGR